MTDIVQARHRRIAAFFVFLFVVEWYLYFWNIGHFFQADTIFLLYHRPKSILDLLHAFIERHPSGWYRPLANDILETIFFPFFGLNPAPYRIPVYALFIANTIALYALAITLTRRHLVAAIATFFFAVHTTGAYVTYDAAFLPELLYTLFYIVSAIAYLRYIDNGDKSALWISLTCFALSLLSKESAVTLPGVLFVLHVLRKDRRVSLTRALTGHVAILICYLLFALSYLHVMNMSFETILARSPQVQQYGGFNVGLTDGILRNLDTAMSWAFNIPRGEDGVPRPLGPALVSALTIFRLVVAAILAVLLFRRDHRIVIVGLAWFVLTLVPALPLVGNFRPYYIFLPIAGFSLLIGAAFAFVWETLRKPRFLGPSLVVAALATVLYVSSLSIFADTRYNGLLGASSDMALNSLTDLKRLYPAIPPGAVIYIYDATEPLWWHHSSGDLIKMSYNNEDISVLYESLMQEFPTEGEHKNLIVLRHENLRLVDETSIMRVQPWRYLVYKDDPERTLTVSRTEASTGEAYFVEIDGIRNEKVQVAYTRDDRPIDAFTATLDSEGRASFTVSGATQRGMYRFVGFNIVGQPDWFKANATIVVH